MLYSTWFAWRPLYGWYLLYLVLFPCKCVSKSTTAPWWNQLCCVSGIVCRSIGGILDSWILAYISLARCFVLDTRVRLRVNSLRSVMEKRGVFDSHYFLRCGLNDCPSGAWQEWRMTHFGHFRETQSTFVVRCNGGSFIEGLLLVLKVKNYIHQHSSP